MTLKAVFFDLDGTLLDTSGDLGFALNTLRSEENLEALDAGTIRQQVSNGATALIKLGFGEDLTEQRFGELRQRLLDIYLANICQHTQPFPGIENLISLLSENAIAWGVVTNKPSTYTEALMTHFEFATASAATVCPDHVGIGKPSPEPLFHACKLAACEPEECIYIGDHERDIESGRNAKMRTIAVGYGFINSPDEYLNWQADHTAATADDIWPIISEYLK